VAVAFLIVCFWASSKLLEPFEVLGVTGTPPGLIASRD
jgi:hypothetical protein